MSSEEQEQNPFTRPGFIAAAGIIAVILILAIALAITNLTRDTRDSAELSNTSNVAQNSPEPSESPTTEEASESTSVCGLPDASDSGPLLKMPETTWEYEDIYAYPSSKEYGPAKTSDEGVRLCFQRSPEGALFATANAMFQSGQAETSEAWIRYFLSEKAENRDELLAETGQADSLESRINVSGFRILEFSADTATVDLATRVSIDDQFAYISTVMNLVWEKGDWKLLPSSSDEPIRVSAIPDLTGYVMWGQ